MVEIKDIKTKQKILFFLLKEFHQICENNKLRYNLFGGSLLGAVRHKGFIPWDDDIDVTMPRSDYEKFIKITRESNNKIFTTINPGDENYHSYFSRFCIRDSLLIEKETMEPFCNIKCYIDVFPVDGYPANNEKSYFRKLSRLSRCKEMATRNVYYKNGIIYKILKCISYNIFRIIGYKTFLKREIKQFKSMPFDNAEYVLCQGAGWMSKGKTSKEKYLDRVLYDFNGGKFWGMKDYDSQLSKLYGDYMKMPPLEKRTSNHNSKWYIDESVLKEIENE